MSYLLTALLQVTVGATDIASIVDYEHDNWRNIVHRLAEMGEMVLAGHIVAGHLAGDEYPIAASSHAMGECYLCQCIEQLTDADNQRGPIGHPVAYAEYAHRTVRNRRAPN